MIRGPLVCALFAAVSATSLTAQGTRAPAGPWVTLGSPLDRDIRWAIDAGALRLNPLVRPFRLAAVRDAAADSAALTPQARRALDAVRIDLLQIADSASLLVEAAVEGYTNGRRETFRAGGRGHVNPALGVWGSYQVGSIVAVLNPALDDRLRRDPEYTGEIHTQVSGRVQTEYVATTGPRGDLLFGRIARNWGSDLFDGLLVSPDAYAFGSLAGSLRVGRLELSAIAQKLSSVRDTTARAVDYNRFFFAHRLDIRLGRDAWLGFAESGVYGGRGQGFDPALHEPLNAVLASEYNDSTRVNILWEADFAARLHPGVRLELSGYLDDIQVDHKTLVDKRPTSYGLTAVVRAMLPGAPLQAALGYTRVSALSYRNSFDTLLQYSNHLVGLGRNFSDYDEVLLRLTAHPARRAWLTGDIAYFRQGSGDFRQPFPPDSVLAQPGQGFLVAPVTRFAAARLLAQVQAGAGIEIGTEIGVTRGATGKNMFIGSFSARLTMDLLHHHQLGGGWSAIDRSADRGWP